MNVTTRGPVLRPWPGHISIKWVVEWKVWRKNTTRKMEWETGLWEKSPGRIATIEESLKITSPLALHNFPSHALGTEPVFPGAIYKARFSEYDLSWQTHQHYVRHGCQYMACQNAFHSFHALNNKFACRIRIQFRIQNTSKWMNPVHGISWILPIQRWY